VPGNICETRNDISPTRFPGKLNRENAYAAVQARKTPRTVVAAATIALFKSHKPKGWSVKTDVKFDTENSAGHGIIPRIRSIRVAFDGTSAIARLCLPEKAIEKTHRIGYNDNNVKMIKKICNGR
jgi:hypothetical protein